ncbi:isocitrate lyase/PEP mutase family protein [Halobaculum litoreum]|uniref:Isocitrate lyase/phosphoenolpyruvate mutase family protein n=1 Tax=Halobaculum litoreum TaxID=3031998 RepID=A0ABD5XRU2_9EURY|nr:isocitrate lyase/phosphoenolpyruvate mutase family protein [Halobaculum sp. DT92]
MDHDTQRERAETLRALHTAGDGPLVLPNAWDAGSAVIFADAGFDAIGTTSAGIAAAQGVPDGEHLSREAMLAVVERIANAVSVPVTADIEAGYGDTPAEVADTVRATVDAGAVGVNLEDGTGDPDRPLADTAAHAAVIRAARAAADAADVPVVVNGRTDVFWLGVGDEATRLERAVERANAYAEAGADCLFVPGVTDTETIGALVDRLDAPLNVLGGPGAPPVDALAAAGVARVSVGSGPMRATLGLLREIAGELHDEGTYGAMAGGIPYGDLKELLAAAAERRDA